MTRRTDALGLHSVRKRAIWADLNGAEAVSMPTTAAGSVSGTIGKTESTSSIAREFISGLFGRVREISFPLAWMNN